MNESFKSNSSCSGLMAAPQAISTEALTSKKMSKGIRCQFVEKHIHKYDNNDGYYSLSSILPKDVRPEEVEDIVTEWLDANCDNGHFSRWTSFGVGIWTDAEDFTKDLLGEYHKFYGVLSPSADYCYWRASWAQCGSHGEGPCVKIPTEDLWAFEDLGLGDSYWPSDVKASDMIRQRWESIMGKAFTWRERK